MEKYKALLTCVNYHMNSKPAYPGDWLNAFPNFINNKEYINNIESLDSNSINLLSEYNFTDINSMVLEIGKAFRGVDENWCNENIVGYKHSEYYKSTPLSKGPTIYNENIETIDFWKRFLSQMLIYRYG